MKKYSMKISEYYEYKKPKYIYLKLTPSYSIRNYNSDKFLSLITVLYKEIKNQITVINKKLFFECTAKLSYYIYMEKSNVEFFFIVPETHFRLFKDKIIDTWSNKITINQVDEIPTFDKDCTKYYMTYKQDDALSLSCDKRNNVLLGSLLTTLHMMEDDDKLGVFYNFFPTKQSTWRARYDHRIEDLKNDKPIYKHKSNLAYWFKYSVVVLSNLVDEVLSNLGSTSKPTVKPLKDLDLSKDTYSKRNATIVNTQILCLSESKDKNREHNNILGVCGSFECLDSDNKLISKKFKGEIDMLDTKFKGVETIKIQPREGQNFISLPARELLEEHKVIDHTKVRNELPPKALLDGTIPLGTCVGKNNENIMTYMSVAKNQKNLPYAIIGANRTGKSTYLQNIAYHAQKGNECTIFFDFCGNCESSEDINLVCRNVLNIDCTDLKNLQGMGYNEVKTDDRDTFRHYDNVKGQASQLIALVNNTNVSDRDLKTKMNKFLRAASLIVFLNNGSFKDVFEVLQDHELRFRYINMIKPQYQHYMDKHIRVLSELDDNKGGVVVGSKSNPAIYGIMDRIDSLQANTYMELMFEKDTKDNINLIDEMQKPQVICFKMPEDMFKTKSEKDSYCTYWMSKIWFALKLRKSYCDDKDLVKVNIIIDELYQVEHCEEFVNEILSQLPKFNARIILSCHHINQLTSVKDELLNANGSYVLIAGCSKQNYNALKEEMYPFVLDDLMSLKEFHSLNLIKLEDGYYNFVTKLPKPLNPKHVL